MASIMSLDSIDIPASRTRLTALAVFALFCFAGGLLNLTPLLSGQVAFTPWAYIFIGFCGLFLLWGLTAAWIALTQPPLAYRLTPQGLFIGRQDQSAFTWDQVRGATLSRGKRRSSITVVLIEGAQLHRPGLLNPWLASFLGRPTDRDLALTNMDTKLDWATFLDLIGPFFHTYGPGGIND